MSTATAGADAEAPLARHRTATERARQVLDGVGDTGGRLASRPLLWGVGVTLVVYVIATLGGTVLGRAAAHGASESIRSDAGQLGTDVLGTLCVVGVLTTWRLWRRVGYAGPSTWSNLRLLVVPALYTLLTLVYGITHANLHGAQLALRLPQPFLTGFWEEGLVRGFFFYAVLVGMLRAGRSPLAAVVTSAVVFGAMHAIALVGGKDLGSVLTQVCYAALMGIGFAAVLLRTNALWLLALVHAVFDVGTTIVVSGSSGGGFSLGEVLLLAPLALYGLFLLRPRRDQHA